MCTPPAARPPRAPRSARACIRQVLQGLARSWEGGGERKGRGPGTCLGGCISSFAARARRPNAAGDIGQGQRNNVGSDACSAAAPQISETASSGGSTSAASRDIGLTSKSAHYYIATLIGDERELLMPLIHSCTWLMTSASGRQL